MNAKQAKEIPIVDYLAKLNYQPAYIRGVHYWYHSPLHEDNTPSFKVNIDLNRWVDWGGSKQLTGNLVDFGVLYHNCDVERFLAILTSQSFPPQTIVANTFNKPVIEEAQGKIEILKVGHVASLPLIRYYRSRKIPDTIANKYLKEVTYRLNSKQYYALGFKNDKGGYELRNEYIKAASMPKAVTFIDNGAKDVAVFEGSFDFLTYLTVAEKIDAPKRNYLILNSTSFFEMSLSKMMEHQRIYLYLDNNPTGDKCIAIGLQADATRFSDERSLYKSHVDLNDWLKNFGAPVQAHRPQQKL